MIRNSSRLGMLIRGAEWDRGVGGADLQKTCVNKFLQVIACK